MKQRFYRLIAAILCVCLTVSMTACGKLHISYAGSSSSSPASSEGSSGGGFQPNVSAAAPYGTYDIPHDPVDFSTLSYTPFDGDTFLADVAAARELLGQAGKEADVMAAYDDLTARLRDCSTAYRLIDIYYYLDYGNTERSEADTAAYTVLTDCNDAYCQFLAAMLASDYRQTYIDRVGEENAKQYEDYEAMTDEQKDLLDREKALEDQYDALSGQDSGEDYKALADAAAPVYLELVDVRNRLAVSYGYDNYADYAYKEVFFRGYTPDEAGELETAVRDKMSNLYLYSLYRLDFEAPYADTNTSADTVLSTMRTYLPQMSGSLGKVLDFMTDCHLCDIDYSDKKLDAGFTTMLDAYGVPFLYNQPSQGSFLLALDDAVHEFGHFNAYITDPTYTTADGYVYSLDDIDVAEIDSTGLELLFLHYYPDIYGDDASEMKRQVVFNILSNVLYGCIMDEFQQKVYAEPDLTEEKISDIFYEVFTSYMGDTYIDDYSHYAWAQVNHNFSAPMYYISYAVSALAALQLWATSETDFDAAVNKYFEIVSYGTNVSFIDLLDECGLDNVFEASTLAGLSDKLKTALLIG